MEDNNQTITKLPSVTTSEVDSRLPISQEIESFGLMQRESNLMSKATLLPKHFQGNMANCYIAVYCAKKLNIDPFMFMQRTYVVSGKLGMEGSLVIALVNTRGPYKGGLKFTIKGEGDKLSCTCSGTREDGSVDTQTLSMADVKKLGWDTNLKWKQMPEQMLKYRTATWLARVHCPEILMGFSTDDELIDAGGSPTTTVLKKQPKQADELNSKLGLVDIETNVAEEASEEQVVVEDEDSNI